MSDWLQHAADLNHRSRVAKYAEGRSTGAAWLIECRDMWDAHDQDAGVFFLLAPDERSVDAALAKRPADSPDERVLAIYDLSRPMAEQGAGLTRGEWLLRKR